MNGALTQRAGSHDDEGNEQHGVGAQGPHIQDFEMAIKI